MVTKVACTTQLGKQSFGPDTWTVMNDEIKKNVEELCNLVNQPAKPDSEVQAEVGDLRKQAYWVIAFLVVVLLISFFAGSLILRSLSSNPDPFMQLFAIALIGCSGSAVGALTSCLDRYAKGFELDDGSKWPRKAEVETFNSRMKLWFYVRPVLGLVVAPVLIWGLALFVNDFEPYLRSADRVAFTAFLGGLLAKSVLDLIKSLFKNVFKA